MVYARIGALVFLVGLVQAADYYVARTGSDTNAGSLAAPFGTVQKAVDTATAGSTIYIRGGMYALTKNIQFKKNGTASAPYTVRAYQSEKVIFDGESLTGTPAEVGGSLANPDRGIFHIEKANYWQFYDFEFINGPYGVYVRNASYNHFERIITHDNYETGFHIEGTSSYNTVLYLDSYRNRDPRKNGESADGFALKQGFGDGNVLRSARLWDNVDDGLDLYDFGSSVTVEDVISWGNGVNRWGFPDFAGDGNGFKLGGGANDPDVPGSHIVRNCIAFSNVKDGFTDNGNTGSITITRSTGWNNGDNGFKFQSGTASVSTNLAALNKVAQMTLKNVKLNSGNSWNIGGTWSNASFVNIDPSGIKAARQAGGKLPSTNFLLPASGAAIGASFV